MRKHIHIICSEGAAEVILPNIAHWVGKVSAIPHGATIESALRVAGMPDLIDAWNELRDISGDGTPRYNDAARFITRAAAADAGQPQPLALLFCDERPRALLAGDLDGSDSLSGIARVLSLDSSMDCLNVPETGVITDSSADAIEWVAQYLSDLFESRQLRRIRMQNLNVDSALYSGVRKRLGSRFRIVSRDHVRLRRQLVDPATGDPIQHNSKKTLQGIRRKRRQLAKQFDGDLTLMKITSPKETDWFVEKAASIVSSTYQAALGIGVQDNENYRTFVREMASAGMLRGYIYLGRGEPVSYVLGDFEFGEFHLWATSFMPQYAKFSPGVLLLHDVFDDLVAEGAVRFDFGHGDAQYKRMLSNIEQQEQDVEIYGKDLRASAQFVLRYSADYLRAHARRTLQRSGHLDQIRKRWRQRLCAK
jgi:hypothetical protein